MARYEIVLEEARVVRQVFSWDEYQRLLFAAHAADGDSLRGAVVSPSLTPFYSA